VSKAHRRSARLGQELTDRELKVLNWMARGATYRWVGRRLGIAEVSARSVGYDIQLKLGAVNITHAVHLAGMTGLIGMYADCGDRNAYCRHVRRKETPDVKCRKAQAAYSAERRTLKKNKISGGGRVVQSRDGSGSQGL
jgi:DNA-binding CsgD family transcriptional regulator